MQRSRISNTVVTLQRTNEQGLLFYFTLVLSHHIHITHASSYYCARLTYEKIQDACSDA